MLATGEVATVGAAFATPHELTETRITSIVKAVAAFAACFEISLVLYAKYMSVVPSKVIPVGSGFTEVMPWMFRNTPADGANLFTEGTVFTLFSSGQILLVGVIAALAGSLTWGGVPERARRAYAWMAVSGLACIMAIDEWFELHEYVAQYAGEYFRMLAVPLKPSYWDVPMFIFYGLAAAVLWLFIRHDIERVPLAGRYVKAAVALLALSVALDVEMHRVLPVVWEDGLKLLGFMFLWLAFLSVYLWRRFQNDRGPQTADR